MACVSEVGPGGFESVRSGTVGWDEGRASEGPEGGGGSHSHTDALDDLKNG